MKKLLPIALCAAFCFINLSPNSHAQNITPPKSPTPAENQTENQVPSPILLERCKVLVSLSVENADISEFLVAAAQSLPKTPLRIEYRMPSNFRITCKLQDQPFGEILQSAAKLSNCNLYFVGESLLIAPTSALNEQEKNIALEYSDVIRKPKEKAKPANLIMPVDFTVSSAISQGLDELNFTNAGPQKLESLPENAQRFIQRLVNLNSLSPVKAPQFTLGLDTRIALTHFEDQKRILLVSSINAKRGISWMFDTPQRRVATERNNQMKHLPLGFKLQESVGGDYQDKLQKIQNDQLLLKNVALLGKLTSENSTFSSLPEGTKRILQELVDSRLSRSSVSSIKLEPQALASLKKDQSGSLHLSVFSPANKRGFEWFFQPAMPNSTKASPSKIPSSHNSS